MIIKLQNSTSTGTFAITDTTRYVLVMALTTKDNTKLLQQMKSDLKRMVMKQISIKSNNTST